MQEEIWRPILGYEGLYEVSNLGRVRSLHGHCRKRGHILSPGKKYTKTRSRCDLKVSLSRNGKQLNRLVSRLVAQAFLPNPLSLPQVNHKDENPTNNRADNLEWCTGLYNVRYGTGITRGIEAKNRNNSKGAEKPVAQISKEGKVICKYKSAHEAARRIGGQFTHICKCCRGELRTHRGFKWAYINREDAHLQAQHENDRETEK